MCGKKNHKLLQVTKLVVSKSIVYSRGKTKKKGKEDRENNT